MKKAQSLFMLSVGLVLSCAPTINAGPGAKIVTTLLVTGASYGYLYHKHTQGSPIKTGYQSFDNKLETSYRKTTEISQRMRQLIGGTTKTK